MVECDCSACLPGVQFQAGVGQGKRLLRATNSSIFLADSNNKHSFLTGERINGLAAGSR